MKYFKSLIQFLVRFLRFILDIPLILAARFGEYYAKFLLLFDKNNHIATWQTNIQKSLNNFYSNEIIINKIPEKKIRFYTPSTISRYRAKTIFSKEPETIEWMNKYGEKEKIFFDIGANIGIYSIYYAKKYNSKVFAFEPSFKNLGALVKNINLNLLNKNIIIVSNPLYSEPKNSTYFQNDFVEGGAEASFDNLDLKKKLEDFSKNFHRASYNTLSMSLDKLYELNLIELPSLIKIDVDGNEIEIVKGCGGILRLLERGTILIETRKSTEKTISKLLEGYQFEKVEQFGFNSIWKK